MLDFIIPSSEINEFPTTKEFIEHIEKISKDRSGYGFYKYPLAGGGQEYTPEIIIFDNKLGICIFDSYLFGISSLSSISDLYWHINDEQIDSPLLRLEDYQNNLLPKYKKYRQLRHKINNINCYLLLPNISKNEFLTKFPDFDHIDNLIFSNYLEYKYIDFWKHTVEEFDEDEEKLFAAISQGFGRFNNNKQYNQQRTSDKMGKAIQYLSDAISLLDGVQLRASIQIPDGPQRVRGMAGTGKTILLAKKAAYLHSRYPDAKILYTFHTQSLYNQIRDLITKFYRDDEEKDPNWNNMLVLHSWGGKTKEGAYYRICSRNSIQPKSYYQVSSFDNACSQALEHNLTEEFDYVLIDESQDLPQSFFQLLYETTKSPHRIIFAYDELQTLSNTKIPDIEEIFGFNKDGTKRVDTSKGSYGNGIEIDYVLKKSYRNPHEILMVAHGIGLGIHNSEGFMQIIDDKKIWNSIGYEVISGNLAKGENVVIRRPLENSANLIRKVYSGTSPLLQYKKFENRDKEINAIARRIIKDIKIEGVEPHDIVVINLNDKTIEDYFIKLQHILFQNGIPSIIPGVRGVEKDRFGEKGFVTLSTVYKAKGNEAFVTYVMSFDYLYDYVEFVRARNRAFTSISRTKGWCRITGIGKNMERAIEEIKLIEADIPDFKFEFPDGNKIAKKLSTEHHARRTEERNIGESAVENLLNIDLNAISEEKLQELKRKLQIG